ncbi:hypothetical protein M1437_00320 [Patescibacteria group bacterium]|nr:hypothetical protein [Patescibacteria group bacterium]
MKIKIVHCALPIMKLKIAQIIGLNTDQKAAQVTSSVRDDNSFLAVLELVCDDAFTRGRQALSELEDFYFEFEGTVSEKLNATAKEAESKFSDATNFDLCLGVVSGKVLYIIGKGQVEVYLKRGSKLSPLLSVGTSSQLISGFVAAYDKLLFCTKNLTTFLGSDLGKSLDLPIEAFEEEVGSKIGTSDLEDQGPVPDGAGQGLAALAAEVMGEENPEISPLPTQQETYQHVQSVPNRPKINLAMVLSKVGGLVGQVKIHLPKSGRGKLIIAFVLILIIALGVGYQYKLSKDKKTQDQFNQSIQESKEALDAAKGLTSLNPVEAKNKLDLSINKVNFALSLKPKDNDAQNLRKQIEQESSSILQQSSVSDFPVFLDMDLVKKNFRALQMSLSGSKLLLFDPGVKTLVMVDLAKKSNQILAGSEQLGDAALASLNGGLAYIFSKDKGILKIDTTNSKVSTVAKKDSDFGEVKDIYAFAGNVYVLDLGKNQIWKYISTSDGYSDKREYFSKDTKADLASTLRMQIESSVYVLKTGGEILRFTKGEKDNFSLSGLPSGVKDPKSIFVSSDTDNLYVLDSGNSRLLILTKIGVYKGQITGDKFATATDLVVDEIGKKVYLLDGGKIYTVDLK